MAWLNIGVCIFCASLSVVGSVPFSILDAKFSNNSPLRKTEKGNSDKGSKDRYLPPLKQTTESLDSFEESEASKRLASITDKMLEEDEFAVNDSIDYDNMEFPEETKLVKPDVPDFSPASRFSELAFQEMHERAQITRITEVKESILSKLRLLAPPNITALKLDNKLKKYPDHVVPRLDEPDDIQQDDGQSHVDDFHAKISTVIQFATDFPDSKNPDFYPTNSMAYFSLPLSISEKNVEKATLMIYITTPDGKEDDQVQLCISETLHRSKPFVNRTVTLTPRGHWEHIDITDVVSDWAADEDKNYGLIVSAMLGNKNIAYLSEDPVEVEKERIVVDGDITARPHRTPLIKIALNEQQGRYKRSFDESPSICHIKERNHKCCRYKFLIDFQQLGKDFDFIIQPRRYLANYCAGSCAAYYLPTDGNSKLMMAFSKPKLQRCCTAMTKKPLSMLYYDEKGNIMLGEIPDMSIEKCYCS